jgi:hypothetical protein
VARSQDSVLLLAVDGVLEPDNAATLRDSIANATLDGPSAVIVDVSALEVPAESTWSGLVGARWQLAIKPDVSILLVCADRATREAIARSGIEHFMPVYVTEKGAMKALGRRTHRAVRSADAPLTANLGSLRESRQLIREWLTAWSQPELIPVALVIVNVLVENVLEHTGGVPTIRIDSDGETATVSVSDDNSEPAVRLPAPATGLDMSGLAIVAALSRAWGCTPTSSGKRVWATIGPENQL